MLHFAACNRELCSFVRSFAVVVVNFVRSFAVVVVNCVRSFVGRGCSELCSFVRSFIRRGGCIEL